MKLLSTSDVSKILGLTPDSVRYHERQGHLPAQRTLSGQRIFRLDDVQKFLYARGVAKCERAHSEPLDAWVDSVLGTIRP